MSYNNRRKPRTYTYRISVDDRKALRKINVLDSLNADYWISELHRNDIPTAGNGRHFGYVFYQSKEHFEYDRNEMVGGAIPGLGDRRYSLEWQPFSLDSALEMRNASGGGTEIKGERYLGTADPRLSDYVPIHTTVPFTPTEIESGDPEIVAEIREELYWAEQDGFEQIQADLWEFIEECDHNHVVETEHGYGDVAYCEDCGHGWDEYDYECELETGNLTVVQTVERSETA